MTKVKLLGDLTLEDFFSEYWEKKPLLIRGAIENLDDLAEVQDLIDLSMDKDFESRLIIQGKSAQDFQMEHGPFDQKKFKNLEAKKWTLIAHNLNLLAPPFFEIQKQIQFLPDWIFDDIMATYSKPGCTVGAHIDNYNVFIFQGKGERKWQLQLNPNKEFIPDIDVKILKEFTADIEWDLKPGDLIYIPPHVAHYGVSTTESISYSIGLKSLDHERLINHYVTWMMSNYEDDGFIKLDFDKKIANDPFKIDAETLSKVKAYLEKSLSEEHDLDLWFTNFLTAPREEIKPGETMTPKELREHLKDGGVVLKDQFARFVTLEKEDFVIFNMAQKEFKLLKEDSDYFSKLFNQEVFEPLNIEVKDLSEDRMFVLLCLIESGSLYLSFDENEDEELD